MLEARPEVCTSNSVVEYLDGTILEFNSQDCWKGKSQLGDDLRRELSCSWRFYYRLAVPLQLPVSGCPNSVLEGLGVPGVTSSWLQESVGPESQLLPWSFLPRLASPHPMCLSVCLCDNGLAIVYLTVLVVMYHGLWFYALYTLFYFLIYVCVMPGCMSVHHECTVLAD